ncbi:putative leucine-rich repeat domain, L domain-like protein [Tanacetum coccineum]
MSCRKCNKMVTTRSEVFDLDGDEAVACLLQELMQCSAKHAKHTHNLLSLGDVDTFPQALEKLVGRKFAFKIKVAEYNIERECDQPLCFTAPSGQETWSYYKVVMALGDIGIVNPTTMSENPSERSNSFDGNIPHQLCYLTTVQILDLADNHLSGNIPRCFHNFTVLSGKENISIDQFSFYIVYGGATIATDLLVTKGRENTYSTILQCVMLLDLSSNNLTGHIPSELTTLVKLNSLNLSRNQLTGRIPKKIGNLKSLESFDVSKNKLYGELPMSLSGLNSLSSFNVSYNNLTRRVPSSTQLQSLNESSFFGNNLCGAPLIERCAVKVPDMKDQDDGSHGTDWG